ncbi:MAG: capsular polysaccharide biosynthesis protein [Alphaproteobacteria bacterium]|nr:MAG: capsular polysaccharide biosynthesis protein [Alphaproteobacteria bacterium]
MRRILTLAGLAPRVGWPRPSDVVLAWGHSPTARRAERVARRTGAPIVRVEDAFIRSLYPGRTGEPPIGLLIDRTGGVHFDSSAPSALERLLAEHPLDDTALLDRAREGMRRMKAAGISKYTGHDPDARPPAPGHVLVVDQTRGDASITHGGADASRFREMLYWAREENPGARIVVKTHPETLRGLRPGHFDESLVGDGVEILADDVNPWTLLEGATRVYTVSSQLGFEAILAGHRPVVFGQPFYAGWGLTDDRFPVARRRRTLSRAQLFAAAMILAPTWYDPARDRLATFEEMLDLMEARLRAWRDDRRGWDAPNMRLWKRAHVRAMFGTGGGVRFRRTGRPVLVWGRDPAPDAAARIEDGFLRSRGLGAQLVPPVSLALDRRGLYYDPSRPSNLEDAIAAAASLPPAALRRAEALIARIVAANLTKYNLGGDAPALPPGRRILVPGQVEDDASVILGAPGPAGRPLGNRDLLERTRAENPDAVIIWKPHPDVVAGLRPGAIPEAEARALADVIVEEGDVGALLAHVDEVWTLTSLAGFEALLRGIPVTCLGTPFYAGWGLTRDLGRVPARRRARPSVEALVHAALIDFPRYRDPVSGLPCPPEVIVERLTAGQTPRGGPALRVLSKVQGLLASRPEIWRRRPR